MAVTLVAGCDVPPLVGDRESSKSQIHPRIPTPQPESGRAYFILHPSVFADPHWPDSYRCYNLFVCDPVMTAEDLARIRTDISHARCLAYTNAQAAARDVYPEAYWQAFTAVFDSSFCIRNLETGNVVRLGLGITSAFVMRQVSADVLVAFHRDVTMVPGWDGLYLDQVTATYPEWKKTRLLEDSPVFDIDDDGVADDVDDLDAQWEAWKPYYLYRLRAELGEDKILLANSDGRLDAPACNGLSIENVGVSYTTDQARAFILSQRELAHPPFLGVLWAFAPFTRAPSESLSLEIPGVACGESELPEADGDVEPVDW